jgi:hypothetical protein
LAAGDVLAAQFIGNQSNSVVLVTEGERGSRVESEPGEPPGFDPESGSSVIATEPLVVDELHEK